MAKQMNLTYDGKEYTLEFTRRTVAEMQQAGFKASEISDKAMIVLPALFAGAFRAHHKYLPRKVIDEIFEMVTNKAELLNKLAEMFSEPLEAMLEEPECEEEKKAHWGANF